MIICFTGHRSNKLPNAKTGYTIPNPTYNYVFQETENLLLKLKPDECISGLALGFDQIGIEVCIKLGIPFIGASPFLGQENIWPEQSKKKYNELLSKAKKVIIVSEGKYSVEKMQIRNCWMVDNSDQVVACFDGTKGGTKNCVDYAISKNKTIHRIDPRISLLGNKL